MKRKALSQLGSISEILTCLTAVILGAFLLPAVADQVEMQNGDRYVGKVVLLTGQTLVIQSDVLGRIELPRSKVAVINLMPVTATNAPNVALSTNMLLHAPPRPTTNTNSELAAAFRQMGGATNAAIEQIQKQFLADAGPEANQKFNELLSGLMSGKMTMSDLRAQARSAADQVRALRKDLGDDAGPALDGYLEILDKFLSDTAHEAAPPPTNSPAAQP